jgi:hypothetical protein
MAAHLGTGFEVLEEALSGWTTGFDDPQIDLSSKHALFDFRNSALIVGDAFSSIFGFDRGRPFQLAVPIRG